LAVRLVRDRDRAEVLAALQPKPSWGLGERVVLGLGVADRLSGSDCGQLTHLRWSTSGPENECAAGAHPSRPCRPVAAGNLCLVECLIQVPYYIIDVLESYRQPDEVLGHAGRELLLWRELLVGCACWVDHERLRVANVG